MGDKNWDLPAQKWHENGILRLSRGEEERKQEKEPSGRPALRPVLKSESLREVVNTSVLSKWPSRSKAIQESKQNKNSLRRSLSSQSDNALEEVEKKTIRILWPLIKPFCTPSKWWNMIELICGLLAVLLSATKRSKSWNPYIEDHHFLLSFNWCKSRIACAQSPLERCLGVLARFTGGCIYAVLGFTLSTMAHATTNTLGRTPNILLSAGLFGTSHVRQAHVRGGKAILYLSIVHGLGHAARWAVRREVIWAISNAMVIVGCLSLLGFCLIGPVSARKVLVEKFMNACCCCFLRSHHHRRKELPTTKATGSSIKPQAYKVPHETWMLWAHHIPVLIALIMAALHVPRLAVVSTCFIFIWVADRLFLTLFRTYLVEAPHLVAISDHGTVSGTLISFNNPDNFKYATGDYVQIRLPWLQNELGEQYHPFSLAPIGDKAKQRSMVYCAASGDWTRALHEEIQRSGDGFGRPMLVCGPYVAPFNTSVTHNYVLVVASGIGITPCLAVLERYGSTRNVLVLWISRDAALLRLYANYLDKSLCRRAVVYHTGKLPTVDFQKLHNDLKPLNVRSGRPDIKRIVNKIVTTTYVESSSGQSQLYSRSDRSGELEDGTSEVLVGDSSCNSQDEYCVDKNFERFESDISTEMARPLSVRPLEPLWTPPLAPLSEEDAISPRAASNNPLPNLEHHKEFLQEKGYYIEPEEWKVLYCGGSRAIGDTLETCCKISGASYAAESFWL